MIQLVLFVIVAISCQNGGNPYQTCSEGNGYWLSTVSNCQDTEYVMSIDEGCSSTYFPCPIVSETDGLEQLLSNIDIESVDGTSCEGAMDTCDGCTITDFCTGEGETCVSKYDNEKVKLIVSCYSDVPTGKLISPGCFTATTSLKTGLRCTYDTTKLCTDLQKSDENVICEQNVDDQLFYLGANQKCWMDAIGGDCYDVGFGCNDQCTVACEDAYVVEKGYWCSAGDPGCLNVHMGYCFNAYKPGNADDIKVGLTDEGDMFTSLDCLYKVQRESSPRVLHFDVKYHISKGKKGGYRTKTEQFFMNVDTKLQDSDSCQDNMGSYAKL